MTLTGIRHEESARRTKRGEISAEIKGVRKEEQFDQFSEHNEQMVTCVSGKDKILLSPIIEWTAKDVWEFLRQVVKVPYCCLYDEGHTRIGCLCCPMSQPRQRYMEIKRYPHVKRNWLKAIQYLIDNKWDKETLLPKSAEDCFDWWISGKSQKRWYADKYIQRHFDFEQDEQGDNNH